MEPNVTITIGTTDIATTLLQQYIERQNSALAALQAERKVLLDKLNPIYELKQSLIREEYEKKLPAINKMIAGMKKLLGKEYRGLAVSLHKPNMGVIEEFYGYLNYVTYNYEKKVWTGFFFFVLPDNENEDEGIFTDLTNLMPLKVKIPDGICEQVNQIFSEIRENGTKIDIIRAELKNPAELQRKVTARLTEQMINDRPELQAQLSSALGAMSVKMLE